MLKILDFFSWVRRGRPRRLGRWKLMLHWNDPPKGRKKTQLPNVWLGVKNPGWIVGGWFYYYSYYYVDKLGITGVASWLSHKIFVGGEGDVLISVKFDFLSHWCFFDGWTRRSAVTDRWGFYHEKCVQQILTPQPQRTQKCMEFVTTLMIFLKQE